MTTMPDYGSRSTSDIDGHNYVCASKAMTWKDRQRTRVPRFDLDDNPFCLERRTNEERHKMQFNKVPGCTSRLARNLATVIIPGVFMLRLLRERAYEYLQQ